MKKIASLAIMAGMILCSCTKGFEEMNVNPTKPTGTDIGPLFNGVVSTLTYQGNEMFYLDNEVFYPESELGALTSDAWGNYQIGTQAVWDNYYSTLSNIRDIETRFDEECAAKGDNEYCDKARAQLIVLKAFKTFKVTDMFGDIPYSEAGKIWYDTQNTSYQKPKFDSQESIYKSLLKELVWARGVLNSNTPVTSMGNTYYSLGSFDVLYANNYEKWGRIANSLILKHGLRMRDKDTDFADTLLVTAYDLPVIDDYYYSGNGGFILWPSNLTSGVGDVNWSFREHRNLRMGETVFAQMSSTPDPTGKDIFDLRMYVFFDTNHKTADFPDGAWVGYPQIRTASTPTEGGSPYERSRDANYQFKGPSCLYSPFNYYMIRDNADVVGFMPRILMSAAEVCFIKAEMMVKGIVPNNAMLLDEMIRKGIEMSYLLWMQPHTVDYAPAWKYTYPVLDSVINGSDIYALSYSYSANIMNELVYNNYEEFDYTDEAYLKLIYQQRWLDLFRQPGEAWSLARRTFMTPTTTGHKKLTSYRMPYPPTEVTYNYDNYLQQVSKMSPHGDSRETKVWWMTE